MLLLLLHLALVFASPAPIPDGLFDHLPHLEPSSEQQAPLTRFPPEGLSEENYKTYVDGLLQLQYPEYFVSDLSDEEFSSFDPKDVQKQLRTKQNGLRDELAGIWWWKEHPKFGHAIFSMRVGELPFKGSTGGVSSSGYPLVTLGEPGYTAVLDTPENRSGLKFFQKYHLEFAFPSFQQTGLLNASWISTAMSFPYSVFPFPAALGEGWNWKEALHWDPKKSGDVAKCFCSVYYKENLLARYNFGKPAYVGLRIIDGQGTQTAHFAQFLEALNGNKLVRMALPSERAAARSFAWKQPPAHPPLKGFLGTAFDEAFTYENNGVIKTGRGKIATSYGGLTRPVYLLAYIQSHVSQFSDGGEISKKITWIGWNNFVLNKVDRYLIVEEEGKEAVCRTYPDKNPPGTFDPLQLMQGRYNFKEMRGDEGIYEYNWHIPNKKIQTSLLSTPLDGSPTNVNLTITQLGQASSARYTFSYSNPRGDVDKNIFDYYKNFDCKPVGNFTVPDICVDSWLALQYECY